MFIAVGIILVFALFFTTRRTASFVLSFFIYVIGCVAYILFFFTQFYMHDYYIIVVLPLFIAAIFLILSIIKDRVPYLFFSHSFKGLILLIFIANVCYAEYRSNKRWHDPVNLQTDHLQLVNIEPYLDSLGVQEFDKVIYWGDFAPNTGFYLMHRRGWGKWAIGASLSAETVRKYETKGAKYLIVDQNQTELNQFEMDFISTVNAKKIAARDRILIFRL